MKKVNFRALIFIDLLASAMGAAILLMLIFATGKKKYPLPAGKPRDFIIYRITVPDDNILPKIFVYDSTHQDEWARSNFYNEEKLATGDDFFSQTAAGNSRVRIWGPCLVPGKGDSLVYNVYVPAPQKSAWMFAVMYKANKKERNSSPESILGIVKKNIVLRKEYRTSTGLDTAITETISMAYTSKHSTIISFNKP